MRVLSWLGRGLLGLLGLLVAVGIDGLIYETIAEARDAKAYPPPGRMVDVGPRGLHILCTGPNTGPTVALIAGGGGVSAEDYPLQDRIARFARVCSYDRPGLGWSPAATSPLSLDDHVADLHALLAEVGAPRPYVLEPESFGGLIALAYARRYPDEVGGLVTVDATEPALWFSQVGQVIKAQQPMLVLLPALAHVGVIRAMAPSQLKGPEWGFYSPHEQGELLAVESRLNPGIGEAIGVYRLTPPRERGSLPAGAFGDRPMVVLRHGQPFTGALAAIEPGWAASQDRLARLSSASRLIVAQANGHEIAQQNPDLVAKAAQDVVARVRARTGA